MNQPSNTPESATKKPTHIESVDSFIANKKAQEGIVAVEQGARDTQEGVADVMAGVNKPKETISERNSENRGDGDFKGRGGQQSDDGSAQQVSQGIMQYIFPGEDVMIRKVRTAIRFQIKIEEKRAKKLEKNLTKGSAQEYNSAIARIRKLKEILSSLFNATIKSAKDLYQKYFTPKGLRKPLSEVE